jgi:eukaryotic-like serine/threonine-protein kinase
VQPGYRLGPYEIVAALGAGGMGEVYRARDTRLGREVAIKVLPPELVTDPDRLRRFEQEARAVAALNHPGILALHDVGTNDGEPYLVTELLEGESLRERLAGGALPVRKAVDFALQIAQGLAAAHEKGIVHRDLKPANVFVTRDGRVKILDFGIAKLAPPRSAEDLARATTVVEATEDGAILGTAGYMSPEQVRARSVDHRSDIFSLGCVLYEMLAGRRAFVRDTGPDTISAILHEEPPALPDSVPRGLEQVVHRCLEKAAEDRFQSAREFGFALQASADSLTAPSPQRVPSRARSWLWAVSTALGAVLAVVVITRVTLRDESGGELRFPRGSRQLTTTPGWAAEPALSPDGSLVAYVSDESGDAEIWLIDVGGGTPLRLTADPGPNAHPTWLPDGSAIAFVSETGNESSIWRIPKLGGAPFLVVRNARAPAISPDGTRIAFAREDASGFSRIAVATLADALAAKVLTGEGDGLWDHEHPSWSPDGRTLCYADFVDLWLVPATGGPARRLTADHAFDRDPVWSADGRWIYFSSLREDTTALWRIATTGGRPQRLTLGTGPEQQPSLSRDGRTLVYSTFTKTSSVIVLDRRTGTRSRLAGFKFASMPDVTHDGSAMVFCSDRERKTDLWLQALSAGRPAGAPVRLTDQPGSVATPAFSPDGRWVAYSRAVGLTRSIWVVPRSGGPGHAFVDRSEVDLQPAYSPDGRQMAFISNRSGREHVWVARIDPTWREADARQFTDGEASDLWPAWSPDGASIAFVRESEVWVAPVVRGSAPRKLTDGAHAEIVKWAPGGGALLVSGLWGSRSLQLRRVSLRDGSAAALDPPVVFGDARSWGSFATSADGQALVYSTSETRGDVWLADAGGNGP